MTKRNQAIGGYGERCAVRHLIEEGLRPVARNWRCRTGEIDIIAWDGPVLAFCEVKTRRTATFGSPAEAVVPRKARRLRGLAAAWLAATGTTADEVRFDVISVLLPRLGRARVEHVKDAFR
ncbi:MULTISPECIES: YraN family protein [unclassified Micromonospora]|uniref:YraN family protein n=1 Tax=unclassified Micromonospora TaxID=2617518 RepID=UPI0022B71605|nr:MULTISPECIES: YraN family protein [unclassified Micromonospora]MCZ7420383.1 YraN family protein [Verrucosispora sp. WMMA2121]WBB89120.1 YraN family protein [Verrucosispora sp. WMMC514]